MEEEDDLQPFPKTTVIMIVSLALILMISVAVFVVFKCYCRAAKSQSGDDDYRALSPQPTPPSEPVGSLILPPDPPPIGTRVTHVNGFAQVTPSQQGFGPVSLDKSKKKKDFKEWYV